MKILAGVLITYTLEKKVCLFGITINKSSCFSVNPKICYIKWFRRIR